VPWVFWTSIRSATRARPYFCCRDLDLGPVTLKLYLIHGRRYSEIVYPYRKRSCSVKPFNSYSLINSTKIALKVKGQGQNGQNFRTNRQQLLITFGVHHYSYYYQVTTSISDQWFSRFCADRHTHTHTHCQKQLHACPA